MFDPEVQIGATWCAYSEVFASAELSATTRDERLDGEPDAVLTTPEEAADWIEEKVRCFALNRRVYLLNDGHGHSGYGETHDEAQRAADYGRNLDVLYQGKSLYLSFHHEMDRRMYLWVEAIHDEDREVPVE